MVQKAQTLREGIPWYRTKLLVCMVVGGAASLVGFMSVGFTPSFTVFDFVLAIQAIMGLFLFIGSAIFLLVATVTVRSEEDSKDLGVAMSGALITAFTCLVNFVVYIA